MKEKIQLWWEQLQRFYLQPVDEMAGWRRRVRYFIEFSYHCYRELIGNKATQMAAALTYYTLFSILPTMVLTLVVMQSFLGDAERGKFKQYVVDSVLSVMGEEHTATNANDQAPGDQASSTTLDATDATAPLAVMTSLDDPAMTGQQGFNEARENLDEWVQGILDKLEAVNFGSIGAVGVLVFIYAATALLRSIESSFNAVYQTFSIKSIIVRLPVYYMVITLGPVVILAGQLVQEMFFSWIQSAPGMAWLAGPLAFIAPLVTIWLVLFLAYELLPNARVKLRAAAIGSFTAAVLWVVVISSFKFYVAGYGYASLYGALALLPLFLFLIWISWLIVLFGLEITYTLQHLEGKRLERENKRHKDRFVDPRYVLPVMAIVGERFIAGQSVTREELATRTNLPLWAVGQMIRRLIEDGYLHETQADNKAATGLALARPAEQIRVTALLEAADQATITSRQLNRQPGMAAFNTIRDAGRAAAAQQTLADLTRPHEPQS